MTTQYDELVHLIIKTAKAHHKAYEDVNGYHPEWPAWYAERMHAEFETLMGRPISVEGIAELLQRFDEMHEEEAPEEKWFLYYARKLLAFYGSEE